jgi:nucleoside-diphosphate-sugar epimerase
LNRRFDGVHNSSKWDGGKRITNVGFWDLKHRLLSSIEKANRLLGYEPQMGFEEGLKKVHEWFTENWADIERSAEF